MEEYSELKLNEKICLLALLIEEFADGIIKVNGRVFKPEDINFDNSFIVSRVLYITSNFIVGENSYNITPKLSELVKNKIILKCLKDFKAYPGDKQIDTLVHLLKFVSNDKILQKLNFIDQIRDDYTFLNLAEDIELYNKTL